MSPAELAQSLKTEAAKLGFEFSAACPTVSPFGAQSLFEWIDAGYAGQMNYFENRRDAYADPQMVMEGAVSLLMLGTRYQGLPDRLPQAGWGRIAGYATGVNDYHDVIHSRLKQLGLAAESLIPGVRWRGVVDTAPLLEREFAAMGGMGWQAKNTMLIHPQEGSYFFLAALLLDAVLDYDQPLTTDHCGTCRRCLDACPTNAFVSERVLDATKCISYLTIELREPIPMALRPAMGDWIFGCDVCQDVCPWNRFTKVPERPEFHVTKESGVQELNTLLLMDDDAFRTRFRRTPMWRAKRRGFLRNVAIAMGNQRLPEFLPALLNALCDAEPLVRGAVAWALGQYREPSISAILRERLASEEDANVREELLAALSTSENDEDLTTHPQSL